MYTSGLTEAPALAGDNEEGVQQRTGTGPRIGPKQYLLQTIGSHFKFHQREIQLYEVFCGSAVPVNPSTHDFNQTVAVEKSPLSITRAL